MTSSGFYTSRLFGYVIKYFCKLRTFSIMLTQFPAPKWIFDVPIMMPLPQVNSTQEDFDMQKRLDMQSLKITGFINKKNNVMSMKGGKGQTTGAWNLKPGKWLNSKFSMHVKCLWLPETLMHRCFIHSSRGGQDEILTAGMQVAKIFVIPKHSQPKLSLPQLHTSDAHNPADLL